VRFRLESRGVRCAYVQLPLVVVDGGVVSVGGSAVAPAPDGAPAVPVPEGSAAHITSPLAGPDTRAAIVPPAGRECRLRPPVEPAPGEREEGEFLIELR